MIEDPRVRQLLDELLDSQATPDEVCVDCPELLPVVRDRWRRMRRVEADLDAMFPPSSDPEGDYSTENTALPQIPGYEVEGLLGRGGMGVVFRARHLRLNRPVALKMTLAGAYAGQAERSRFQREAEAVACLRHPNIVQLYDIGDTDGRAYFTMEYVEGGCLAQKLAGKPLSPRQAATMVSTLSKAVEVAHQGGVVHRDLKPGNILLTADGAPKITDFGLARRLDGEAGLTQTGAAIGTPSYMSPEQARGQTAAVGPAVDIYALGAILYELLTGRPPFRAETPAETFRQVITQDPALPSRLNNKVPRDLETICLQCLHKEAGHRYSSAALLSEDLDRFLKGEAITARPEGRLARMFRQIRHRPAVIVALAAGMLLILAALGGGLWLTSERAATARAADADLQEMNAFLGKSSWPEAYAALERAKGRLGDRTPAALRNRMDEGVKNLALASRLDKIRLNGLDTVGGASSFPRVDEEYAAVFREAGLGQVNDSAEEFAAKLRASSIQKALVEAIDNWAFCAQDQRRRLWLLSVAKQADAYSDGWRDLARNPKTVKSKATLAKVVKEALAAPADEQSVTLMMNLALYLHESGEDSIPFLKKIQLAHPKDYWVNIRLGELYVRKDNLKEATRFYQAALAVRPEAALIHNNLGIVLRRAGRNEEAVDYFQEAVRLDPGAPGVWNNLIMSLMTAGRHAEAIARAPETIRLNPNAAPPHIVLGLSLEATGRPAEAIAEYRLAVATEPRHAEAQKILRSALIRHGKTEEALAVWPAAIAANPADHDSWYGYAEYLLFLGREDAYRIARQALLAKFGDTGLPTKAERTARTCLLLSGTETEMRQAAALAAFAMTADRSAYGGAYPFFLFVQGLGEYRQGRYDRAISTMRGDAARVFGPAPRLVLAMALHQSGQTVEARKTLAAAVSAYDWRPSQATEQDSWIFHILRREAEGMILPNLTAFLEGKHQPQDNEERLTLAGICQFKNRSRELSQLYMAAFADNPRLADDHVGRLRLFAARAAALTGGGRGEGAANLSELAKSHWRDQARQWLRAELATWAKVLNGASEESRELVRRKLTQLQTDPDLSALRQPSELAKISDEERMDSLALWDEVTVLLVIAQSEK
ncbi:serine/threonine-protein kinase [Zavarzinella formosa]|uniref:serine/threonine-protein kinase n=1 Tax=Zavarzinella formosa TaxID=360055 RepID=UPI0002D4A6E0|nr:serine/threonine-protein kinase [Zavarzinella formosa]